MDRPDLYVKNNGPQRRDALELVTTFVKKMTWRSNEKVLDIGCGSGDVTSEIIYPNLKNIEQLIGVDESPEMIEYALKNYRSFSIDFKVLDIANADDCYDYMESFDKIFSSFCIHWLKNKLNAFNNIYSMLKRDGEIVLYFLSINSFFDLYKHLDEEWRVYAKGTVVMKQKIYSCDEYKSIFTRAGFRILYIEESEKKFTFPDLQSFISYLRPVDEMFHILPPHLHDRYLAHVKDIICESMKLETCPDTGKVTYRYLPITVHAIKDRLS